MTLATPEALAALLRRDKNLLVAAWEARVQQLVLAGNLPGPVLRDDVPNLFEGLAAALTHPGGTDTRAVTPSAAHGASRQQLGAHLTEIVEEYRMLRDTIVERAANDGMLIAGETSRALNQLIDEGIKAAIGAYIARRDEAEGRRRDDYLRFIVHDLRSPLSAVYYAILLAEKDLAQVPVAERVREIHAAIKRNVERMRGLIVKLLQEEENLKTAPYLEPALAPVELRPLVQEAVRTLAPLAAAGETDVANEITAGLRARADAELLGRAWRNLLSNAIDYAPKGHVKIAARARAGRIECRVSDDGRGMPPDLVQALFAPGISGAENERAVLGLAIARRVVQAHGGRLDLETEAGKGTVVRFSLPGA